MKMCDLVKIVSISVILLFSGIECDPKTPLKVTLYYESLCGGCRNFITTQIFPSFSGLKDDLVMDWVPYGWAKQTKIDGKWIFECQHGVNECKGNMYEACALNMNNTGVNLMGFINCMELSGNPADSTTVKHCAESFTYDWPSLSSCFNGNEGPELLAALGLRTQKMIEMNSVPTVVYNDVFDENLNEEALNNFLTTTCAQIPSPKPSVCNDEIILNRI